MRRHGGLKRRHQLGLHELIVVGNVQADHGFVRQLLREFLVQPPQMFLLHHENYVGPAKVAGGDADARTGSVPAERA